MPADPGSSDAEAAVAGPSPQPTCLVDVMVAVPPAIGQLGREDKRAVRLLSRGARSAVEGAISALDLFYGTGVGGLPADHAALRGFVARLPGLQKLAAPWDAALLGQVAAARSGMGATVRRMELLLPGQPDLTLGADLGLVLAAFPGLEVRTPLICCGKRGQALGVRGYRRKPLPPRLPLDDNFLISPDGGFFFLLSPGGPQYFKY